MSSSSITDIIQTPVGPVQRLSTRWDWNDFLGAVRVRWSIRRMAYRVDPGIYAVGNPDRGSNVLVTGNYKLSVDHLRRSLEGVDCWLLVIDTRGVNVWCAAGKGTFGTRELIRRIRDHKLSLVVDHRKLILPQLGATGVAAFKVLEETGFRVLYGPVRAMDIRSYLNGGLHATDRMRTVFFPFSERLKLIPADLLYGKHYLLMVPLLFLVLSGLGRDGYSVDRSFDSGWRYILCLFTGYLSGAVLTPALLPWIPFRRFSLKGLLMGWLFTTLLVCSGFIPTSLFGAAAWYLMIGAVSSFMAMNFTGSSTFTSLSGVRKEMKVALPMQIAMASLGFLLWLVSLFLT